MHAVQNEQQSADSNSDETIGAIGAIEAAEQEPVKTADMDISQADADEETAAGLEEVAYEIGDIQATATEIKSWQEAYETKQSKDKDYTQKTQKLAEDRKAAEGLREKLEQEQEFFSSIGEEIDELLLGDLKDVDLAELIERDPAQYERTKQKIEHRKQWKQAYQAKLEARLNTVVAEAQQVLFADLGWVGNNEKYQADTKSILKYVAESKISNKSFAKINDPKIMAALLDAAKYRELQAKKPTTTKLIKKAPTIAKPSTAVSQAPKSLAERMFPNMK